MQNGLPFWYVREPPLESVDPGGTIGNLFADDRVVGAVVHVSGQIVAPGVVRQSGGLRYVLGEPSGGGHRAALDALGVLLRDAGLAPEIDANVRATVWLKLVNNARSQSDERLARHDDQTHARRPGCTRRSAWNDDRNLARRPGNGRRFDGRR